MKKIKQDKQLKSWDFKTISEYVNYCEKMSNPKRLPFRNEFSDDPKYHPNYELPISDGLSG